MSNTNQSKEEGSFSGGASFAAEFLKFYPELAQLVNACKQDWQGQGSWSEWDQSVYQRFIALGAKAQASVQPCPCFDRQGERISPCFRGAEGVTAAKHQPCGCVLCTCEDEEQCHGCGAKFCAEHASGRAVHKDAERYRWLRNNTAKPDGTPFIARSFGGPISAWTGEAADNAIDSMMRAALSSQSEARNGV